MSRARRQRRYRKRQRDRRRGGAFPWRSPSTERLQRFAHFLAWSAWRATPVPLADLQIDVYRFIYAYCASKETTP